MRRWRLRRVLLLSTALLLLGGYSSGSAAEGPYPGLPEHTEQGRWAGATQGGVSETVTARQWARVPVSTVAAYTQTEFKTPPPPDPRTNIQTLTNYTYLVAPAGSEANYGMSPPFTVRTVAFGAIPVEATVQLIQRRHDGLPVPIIASHITENYLTFQPGHGRSRQHLNDTTIHDVVTLRVTKLIVDNVDLGLRSPCQTRVPGNLTLVGKGWWQDDDPVDRDAPWKTGNYAPGLGGVLNGTVDVPPFSDCLTTGGEDLSRLLTATVSGAGNPVQLNVSAPSCSTKLPPPSNSQEGPPPPGATTPEAAGCLPQYVPPEIPVP